MEAIEAIRAKFAPAPAGLPTRVEREMHSERLSLRKLARRGLHSPQRRPLVISDEERELRDRERETRQAYEAAVSVEAAADRDLRRVHADGQGLMTKILTPGAYDRAERHYQRCYNARLLAEGEHREATLALNDCQRRREAQRRVDAYAEIAEQDRRRAAERRAAGLPPLPHGEIFTLPRDAFRRGS